MNRIKPLICGTIALGLAHIAEGAETPLLSHVNQNGSTIDYQQIVEKLHRKFKNGGECHVHIEPQTYYTLAFYGEDLLIRRQTTDIGTKIVTIINWYDNKTADGFPESASIRKYKNSSTDQEEEFKFNKTAIRHKDQGKEADALQGFLRALIILDQEC